MKARRAAMSETERAQASAALCLHILVWLEARPERTLGIYLARPEEISLDGLVPDLLRRGYTLAAPRVDLENQRMTFWRLASLDAVEIGPWQVRQPIPTEPINEIPLLFVPGLAFDTTGARLGMGSGWYDRSISGAPTLVGVAFEGQIVPAVPVEAHDRRVHFLGTASRWLEIGG